MGDPAPVFVDCYGDVERQFTDRMHELVPELEVCRGKPANEYELIRRLYGRRNALVYMAYISARVLNACDGLKSIAYLSTGLATHGDLAEAGRLGIRFEGVKGYSDRSVAEHAVTLALAGLKRLAEMDRAVRGGSWRLMRSENFQGKTFGVIGLGGIGKETARLAHALGARTIGWSRSGRTGAVPIELADLDTVLRCSDMLSLHLALTPETEGFLDAGRIGKLKPGVVLVNTARAEIVVESALVGALNRKRIGHAGLDVFHEEPVPADHPLLKMANVTLTPHSAWLTSGAVDQLLVAGLTLLRRQIEET